MTEAAEEMRKAAECEASPHGCRLVCDGLVCTGRCEWLAQQPPAPLNPYPENEGT